MPSLNKLWIPTIAAVYALVFIILLYAWEHLFGTVSSIIRSKARRKEGTHSEIQKEDKDDEHSLSKKSKKNRGASEKLRSDQVPFADFVLASRIILASA